MRTPITEEMVRRIERALDERRSERRRNTLSRSEETERRGGTARRVSDSGAKRRDRKPPREPCRVPQQTDS